MVKLFAIIIASLIVIGFLSPYLYNLFPFSVVLQYLTLITGMIKNYVIQGLNVVVTSGNLWLFIVVGIVYFILSKVVGIFFKTGGKE